MKKSLMLLLCAGSVITASAQKNSVLLFGNFGGSSAKDIDGSSSMTRTGFNITPGLGYQVSDKWTLGVEGTFNYNAGRTTNLQYSDEGHQVGIGGGLFARYTVPINNFLFFYTQAEGIYFTSKNYQNGNPPSNFNNLNLKISPNIGINIKNGYALNLGFGSVGYNMQHNSGFTSSNFFCNFSQGLTVGVSKNFIRHSKATAPSAQ